MSKTALLLLLVAATLITTVTAVVGNQDEALKIYEKYGCRECHAISALKIGVDKSIVPAEDDDGWGDDTEEEAIEPPDLSNVGTVRDAKWISKWMRKKIDIDGIMHKKRFQGSKEERHIIALWLESLKYDLPDSLDGISKYAKPAEAKP